LLVSGFYVLFEIWRFIREGLYDHERRTVTRVLPVSVGLLAAGISFGYYVLIPISVQYLYGYGGGTLVSVMPGLDDYVSLFFLLTVMLGLTFQMPLAVIFAVKLKLVSIETLKKRRKLVIMGAFVLSAVVTPPDVVSQFAMAIPMIALFEAGLIAARFVTPVSVADLVAGRIEQGGAGVAGFADGVKRGASGDEPPLPPLPPNAPPPPAPSGPSSPPSGQSGSPAPSSTDTDVGGVPPVTLRPPSGGTVESAGASAGGDRPMADAGETPDNDSDDEQSVASELKSMLGSDPTPQQGIPRQAKADTRARMAAELDRGFSGPALTPAGLSRDQITAPSPSPGRTPGIGTPRLVPDTDGALPPEEVAFRRLLRVLGREVRQLLDKFVADELPKLVSNAVEKSLKDKGK
jgi:hypothetical protein